jgi:hypothetical protein
VEGFVTGFQERLAASRWSSEPVNFSVTSKAEREYSGTADRTENCRFGGPG